MTTLADLSIGEKGIITRVKGRGSFRKRITEMGFIRGKDVTVLHSAPLMDPVEYRVMGYTVSLRRNEARLIEVAPCLAGNDDDLAETPGRHRHRHRCCSEQPPRITDENTCTDVCCGRAVLEAKNSGRIIDVALVGNPNCGKTTLFNRITGAREKVGNYTGVTVEVKRSRFSYRGYIINMIDLPGTYSLSAYSQEERIVREHLINEPPDVVVNVVDSSNLERNLYLTAQLVDMDQHAVVALNMFDILEKQGDVINMAELGKLLGMPIVPTAGATGRGIEELFDHVIDVYESREKTIRHIHIPYGAEVEKSITSIQTCLRDPRNISLMDLVSSRFLAIKLLEGDSAAEGMIRDYCINCEAIHRKVAAEKARLETLYGDDVENLISDARFGFIAGALEETFISGVRPRETRSERIDRIVSHRILGFPIFFTFMALTFHLTFSIGQKPASLIKSAADGLINFMTLVMGPGLLTELVTKGIIPGMASILVFVPGIMILFLMISLLEDSGYMARASFIMDRVMHRMGLHGKSFIPLLMGFGCNVPAIMATRTLESPRDRLITMLIVPFMSCSARLPVYLLFIGAFFPQHGGLILFFLYSLGILSAFITARLLRRTIVTGEDQPFVLELPPYRVPRPMTLFIHMWERAKEYLKKIGGVILIASILIWFLGAFPRFHEKTMDYEGEITHIKEVYDTTKESIENDRVPGDDKELVAVLEDMKNKHDGDIEDLKARQEAERLSNSYIGRIGRFIEPVMAPLGFDWKMSVSLVTGLAAKEVVVSTLAVLDSLPGNHGEKDVKADTMGSEPGPGSEPSPTARTPVQGLVFMVFVLLYVPCAGVLAAIARESRGWRWALFSGLYTTAFAWMIAWMIKQAGGLFL